MLLSQPKRLLLGSEKTQRTQRTTEQQRLRAGAALSSSKESINVGRSATLPNCVILEDLTRATATFPNCVILEDLTRATGTFPICVTLEDLTRATGTLPNCVILEFENEA